MRIGFDAKRAYQNYTGLGNYSRDILQHLIANYPDNEYKLFAPKEYKNPRLNFLNNNENTETIFPDSPIDKTFKGYWRSVNMEKSILKNNIDVYHGLSNEIPRIKSHHIPYVVTIHDLIFKRFPRYYRSVDRKIYNLKFKYAVNNADTTIAISEQTKRDLIEFYKADPNKIKVIYQSCHENFRKQYSNEVLHHVKKKFSLPDQFILNVGTIESRKNLHAILNAVKIMKNDVPLVVVGRKTKYMNFVKIQLKKMKFDMSKLFFLHDVSIEELPSIYQLSSVFVYPSLFEGFGIPIIEALSSGVPVISTINGCFKEAGGPESLYIDPNDYEDLADKIDLCLENENLRLKMKEAGHEFVKKFDPKIISKEIMNVYQSF